MMNAYYHKCYCFSKYGYLISHYHTAVRMVHVYSKGFCKESDLSCYQHCRLEMHAALVWSPDPLTVTRRRGR